MLISRLTSPSFRWVRSGREGVGRGGRPPVQEVPAERPDRGADPGVQPLPPVAREAVRRRADTGAVPHVHPVQGHERGLPLPPGHAGVPPGDRGSPPQAGLQDPEQTGGLRGGPRPNRESLKTHLDLTAQLQTVECNKHEDGAAGSNALKETSLKPVSMQRVTLQTSARHQTKPAGSSEPERTVREVRHV